VLIKGAIGIFAALASIASVRPLFVAVPRAAHVAKTNSNSSKLDETAVSAGKQIRPAPAMEVDDMPASTVSDLLIDNSMPSKANSQSCPRPVPLPDIGLASGIDPAAWAADLGSDTGGITPNSKPAAAGDSPALYADDGKGLQMNSLDDDSSSAGLDSGNAGAPQALAQNSVVAGGASGVGGSNNISSPSATGSVTPLVRAVPEPSAGVLMLACAGLALRRRARRR
jgi:hypothetical protein